MLGVMEPDPVGLLLGTGYQRFASPFGIDGLCIVTATCLDLLAVEARTPRHGHFRHFIQQCKNRFQEIVIWHVDNPILKSALIRYGFEPTLQIGPDGERIPGFRWERPSTASPQ